MIYYRHKETGFIASHKDLKERYQEVKEKGIYNYKVKFIAPYKLLPYEEEVLKNESKMYEYNVLEIPFSDDFEIIDIDEKLRSKDYERLINILELSHLTYDGSLLDKVKIKLDEELYKEGLMRRWPIIHNKIRIELLLNNF